MLVNNKIVFITGASRGIGQAAAVIFAKNGAQLVLHGSKEESLENTLQLISNIKCSEPVVIAYEVRDLCNIQDGFKQIKQKFGRLDVLINNAGIMKESLVGMIRETLVEETIETNLHAVLYHMQYASRLMMKQREGSIINLSSLVGINGSEGNSVYAASKAGVIGATKSVAKELAPYNIRVNAVAPGFIETDLTSHYKKEQLEKVIRNIRMKRIGKPEEVANVLLFLASDYSTYVTGQVIGVDGGMVM